MGADFWIVLQWWAVLFLVGAIAFPLTKRLFANWWDGGYFFAKAAGMAVVTYLVYLVGTIRLLPFTLPTIVISMVVVFGVGLFLNKSYKANASNKTNMVLILVEEVFFLVALLFWSWIKGHEPSIRALEKFMDFGFTKSVLNSLYFPAPDMWYAGGTINYYYFGHIVLAVLTKLSGVDLAYTFNLMLATLFALTLTMSFSIGYQIGKIGGVGRRWGKIMAGVLTAFLVTLAGNLQTVYAFTQGYTGDPPAGGPPPFWQLGVSLEGLAKYWYANATRFIPYTIHEFPSYSFVVSDVHGHVMSLPFVLLAIGLLIIMSLQGAEGDAAISLQSRLLRRMNGIAMTRLVFYGFLVGILLMTNALDGPIYFGLFFLLTYMTHRTYKTYMITTGMVAFIAGITSLPFLLHFKSFVNGIGVNCPPAFLANTKIGPFLFEGVEKCQHSPLWMLFLLWGFFLYCGLGLLWRSRKLGTKITQLEKMLLIFFIFSIGLIIFPEFLYFKDIYPAHFRSNTMFKLGYDAFILLGIVSGYTIVTLKKKVFFFFLMPLLFLVSIYPIFSVRSYFNSLRNYEGLDGLAWVAREYPDDYAAMQWFKKGSPGVIVEADGDSYTDYARFSAFTGLPTIIGWPVHEWLWRGTYDVVAPRREEVRMIYESNDLFGTQQILNKYHVRYVMVGALERTKYTKLAEEKFTVLGQLVFRSAQTVIYQMPSR